VCRNAAGREFSELHDVAARMGRHDQQHFVTVHGTGEGVLHDHGEQVFVGFAGEPNGVLSGGVELIEGLPGVGEAARGFGAVGRLHARAAGCDPVENGGFALRVAGHRLAGGGGVQHPEHTVFGEGDMFDDLENAPAVRRRAGLVGYFGYGVHGGMKGQGAFFQNSEDIFASFRVHAL